MKTKIAINGFGRIGRIAFRIAAQSDTVEVVAVNDLLDVDHLAYLLEYDSVHGRYQGEISVKDGNILVDGRVIRENLKWDEVQAEIVLDCTGIFTETNNADAHIKAGAKKVVISAPSKTAPMFVMGVNHMDVKASDTIVSNASCTTNCLAPMAKIIDDNLGIVEGLMTTTGAAVAVTKVIPSLAGKLTGMAFRVPTVDVSVVDLTVRTKKSATAKEVNQLFKDAANGAYKGVVSYTDAAVVSMDYRSDPHTCNFDAEAGIALNDNFFKLVAWYDNEYGYSAKLIELTAHVASL